jgi:hypothetical protein
MIPFLANKINKNGELELVNLNFHRKFKFKKIGSVCGKSVIRIICIKRSFKDDDLEELSNGNNGLVGSEYFFYFLNNNNNNNNYNLHYLTHTTYLTPTTYILSSLSPKNVFRKHLTELLLTLPNINYLHHQK